MASWNVKIYPSLCQEGQMLRDCESATEEPNLSWDVDTSAAGCIAAHARSSEVALQGAVLAASTRVCSEQELGACGVGLSCWQPERFLLPTRWKT